MKERDWVVVFAEVVCWAAIGALVVFIVMMVRS